VVGAAASAACGLPAVGGAAHQPVELAGTFELLMQNGTWLVAVQRQAQALQQQYPQAQINITIGGSSAELFDKIRTTTAAGTPPDGFWHYSHSWRGFNAATIMLPLTPTLFRREELERLTYANLLNAVWAKRSNEVYFLPWLVGMNAARIVYNAADLSSQGVDPKTLSTLDGVAAAAVKLTLRQGGTLTRAGLAFNWPENLLQNWILDQGAMFYDEQARKWTWQTPAAEQALQWMVDATSKLGVTWPAAQAPAGMKEPIGQGYASLMAGAGAYQLSGYPQSYPDVKVGDVPAPGFVAAKPAQYYVPGIAGFSLAALLKPDSMKAKIGAAYYRLLFTPDASLLVADNYSGAILTRGLYTDPRFSDTRFAAQRSTFAEQVIARAVIKSLVVADSTTQPDFAKEVQTVLAGDASVKSGLAALQELFSAKEDEAWRTLA
jgi:hypothetical protein